MHRTALQMQPCRPPPGDDGMPCASSKPIISCYETSPSCGHHVLEVTPGLLLVQNQEFAGHDAQALTLLGQVGVTSRKLLPIAAEQQGLSSPQGYLADSCWAHHPRTAAWRNIALREPSPAGAPAER